MDPAIQEIVEGHRFGRFRRMMADWDITDTVEAYEKVIAERGVSTTLGEIYLAIMTTRMFWIATVRMLEAHERRSNPAYWYILTWKSPFIGGMFGACHGIDRGFLLCSYKTDFFEKDQVANSLSRNKQHAWITFARTGDPSCEGLGKWPAYGERCLRITEIGCSTPPRVPSLKRQQRRGAAEYNLLTSGPYGAMLTQPNNHGCEQD